MKKQFYSGFIIQSILTGLATAGLLLLLWPELISRPPELVEIQQVAPHTRPAGSGPVSYADAVAIAKPAVVNIYTRKLVTERRQLMFNNPIMQYFFGKNLSQQRQRLQTSLGSGVIISTQGYILTNNHVIAGADQIKILLADGRTVQASVVGSDPDTDLSVLQINLDNLPSIIIGESNSLRVGDVTLAIGNPFGVGQTVTLGIVSAKGRNQLGINAFEDFIQTDAAINPGNSGGALINAYGELIGINTAIFSKSGGSQGIGFAIPVNLAKDIMKQIIEHGSVVRGWLGIEAQDLNAELARSLSFKGNHGVLISGIFRNGPAHLAGLQPGDIITHINNKAVSNARNTMNQNSRLKPGTTIQLRIVRMGNEFEKQVRLIRRPQQE
ncbi:MAG: trypsin-like serine protease [Gammaproteobacteria bacterium]|nr:trypsin-like serine protease [Gammaproteobacteria bacterium]